jgi:flagellar hook protein FlgE
VLRSMYSAISGMQGFQTKLDVIGNNIANVNTTGFKTGRVDFSDVLSQTMSGGSAPNAVTGLGGTNPKQVGLGVKVADIQTLFTQGADQTTGIPTDLALNGNGLFVVSPNPASANPTLYYTRAGDFTVDKSGNLVLPNGQVAMGVLPQGNAANGAPPAAPLAAGSLRPVNINAMAGALTPAVTLSSSPDVQIGADGSVSVTDNAGNRQIIGYLALAVFPNSGGLNKVGDTEFAVSSNSGNPTYVTPGQQNSATILSGALEMSNVDLTREFTEMIVAQRGFDANSKVIGTANAILQDVVNLKNS